MSAREKTPLSGSLFGVPGEYANDNSNMEQARQARKTGMRRRIMLVLTALASLAAAVAVVLAGCWLAGRRPPAPGGDAHRMAPDGEAAGVWKPQLEGNPESRLHLVVTAQNDMSVPGKLRWLLEKAVGIKPSTVCVEFYYLEGKPDATREELSGGSRGRMVISGDGKALCEFPELDQLDYDALRKQLGECYRRLYPDAQYQLDLPPFPQTEPRERAVPELTLPRMPGPERH